MTISPDVSVPAQLGGRSRLAPEAATLPDMSKRRTKKRINARRKKANHGRKPNSGRR